MKKGVLFLKITMDILNRLIIIIVFIGLVNNKARGQNNSNYFKKIEVTENKFKLIPALDSTSKNIIFYPPRISGLTNFEDSLFLLKSLLSFQADTSFCSVEPMNYPNQNPNMTSYFVPNSANYKLITIEIEALFIFNFIIEPKPFYLASYPRLQEGKFGYPAFDKMLIVNDPRLRIIYEYYRKWLKKCEYIRSFQVGYFPLDNSIFSWL